MRIGQVLFQGPVVYDVDVACVVWFSNEEAVDKKGKGVLLYEWANMPQSLLGKLKPFTLAIWPCGIP